MSHENDIKELIKLHHRRLQELKKQQAMYGISADPRIPVEIEEIEAQIEKLQAELGSDPLPAQKPVLPAQVLVVEDNPIWQDILRDCLVEAGHLVEVVPSFKEARNKLQTGHFKFVTLDANLSDGLGTREGMFLLDYIHNQFNPSLPVIIISGEIERRDLIRAFKKFAVVDVLLKEEFDLDEFRGAVENALQFPQG